MKTFKQHITELFEKPYPWKKKKEDDVTAVYQSATSAKDIIKVVFSKGYLRGIDNLLFTVAGNTDTTGGGDAFKIMSTVLDIIKDYIKNNDPDGIKFAANKDEYFGQDSEKTQSREKLYNKMIERFAKKAGYVVYADKHKYGTQYKLTKK
jgi:hypothetical protein